jgi:CRISPR-associated exonuclease Cas4
MIQIAVFIAFLALALLWLARRQQQAAGLPEGKLIYADTRGWLPVAQPLYDPDLGLTGRPDYLIQQGEQVIPVEVKSSRAPQKPYDTHIYQLAAYCLLVKHAYNVRPRYGILHYPNRTYRIEFTRELEGAVLTLLGLMHAHEHHEALPRSHDSPVRCRGCGFRSVCDQRLG